MAEMTKEELEQVIKSVVAKAIAERELATKGSTEDTDKIIFTRETFKERLERAKKQAVKQFLEELGVDNPDVIKEALSSKQQQQPESKDVETPKEDVKQPEDVTTETSEQQPESATTPGKPEIPETVQKPTEKTIDIRDPKVPIDVVIELARQLDGR